MKNFIKRKNQLTENEINELLYYYNQGINMGKEEFLLRVINNMIKLNFNFKTISKIVNIKEKEIKNYII